jgi:hypothetical protein
LKQPDRTSKATDEYSPEYGGVDTRPGFLIAILGAIILGVGGAFYATGDEYWSNMSLVMLIGLVLLLAGCYCVSMKRSPI